MLSSKTLAKSLNKSGFLLSRSYSASSGVSSATAHLTADQKKRVLDFLKAYNLEQYKEALGLDITKWYVSSENPATFDLQSADQLGSLRKANERVHKFLSPWPREVSAHKKANPNTKETNPPVFILGRAGEVAMDLWKTVANGEGGDGLNRTEMELMMLVAYLNHQNGAAWREIIRTPDVILPLEKKLNDLEKFLCGELGCTEIFFRLMAKVLVGGNMTRLDQILTDFQELNRAFRREVDVRLITGKALDQSTLNFYKSTIALDFLDPKDNMLFSHEVDPRISGYKVVIDGKKIHDFTHNADINDIQRKSKKANTWNPREVLYKDLEGVLAPSDIEKIWQTVQETQAKLKGENRS
jgi:F0F1-type ATP synthase delta subunit